MARCSARFETGTNGNTIATGDTGDSTAWDSVSLGTGGTAVYNNTLKHDGALSGKLTRGTAGTVILQWTGALGTVTDHYGRAYVYLTAAPASAFALVLCLSGASNACQVRLDAAGRLRARDSTGSETLGAVALAVNQWVRIEWHFVHSTTVGQIEIKLFNNTDDLTATDTITATGKNTLASGDRIRFQADVNASYVVQFDDLIAGATAYPGPSQLSFAGAITPTGSVRIGRALQLAVSGAIAPVGALRKAVGKKLSGSLTPAGALQKTVYRHLAGALTPAGKVGKSVRKKLAGSIAPSGVFRRGAITFHLTLSGSITPRGLMGVAKTLRPYNWGAFRDGRGKGAEWDPSGVRPKMTRD